MRWFLLGLIINVGLFPGHDENSTYMRSDTDRTPSPSPNGSGAPRSLNLVTGSTDMNLNGFSDDSPIVMQYENGRTPIHKSDPSNPQRMIFKTKMDHRPDSSTPAPPGIAHPVLHTGNSNGVSQRRPRPETSHQKAVNINRKMRIDHILHKQLMSQHSSIRKQKKRERSSFGFMAMKRIKELPEDYDTDHEQAWGPGGLVPNPREKEDFGEEALRRKKTLDRAVRRLLREEAGSPLGELAKGYSKRKRKEPGLSNGGEHVSRKRSKNTNNQSTRAERNRNGNGERYVEGLDDLDLDLLGESRDDDPIEDEIDEDSGIEDSDGDGDDATEDEMIHGS